MITRRRFFRTTLQSVTALASVPVLAKTMVTDLERAPSDAPARLMGDGCVVDIQTYGSPGFEVKAALDAGFTAMVVDIPAYPRTMENAVQGMAAWNCAIADPESQMLKVLRREHLALARERSHLGIILSCQDGSILGASTGSVNDDNLANLRLFHDLGMRMLGLTHNERNALGDSFRESSDAGLSHLGRSIVESMNTLGMIVELSHCGDRTTLEAIELSTKPCMITHAGCRALHPSRRNKSDEQIRALADRGGLFGVFHMTNWLTEDDQASVDTVVDHIVHAVQVGGVDHVAFGSDGLPLQLDDPDEELEGIQGWARRSLGLPGAETIPSHVRVKELNCPERMMRIAETLQARGLAVDAIQKIIGGNFCRVFGEICG